jgi:hypothetical protein
MKSITKLSLVFLTAMAFAAFPAHAQSDSTSTNTPAPPPRPRAQGVAGTITAVDATAMTVTLKGRGPAGTEVTVKVTSDTKITKGREPAVFADLKEGVRVNVLGKKEDDGTWTASTVRISTRAPRPPSAATPPAAPPGAPPASGDQK